MRAATPASALLFLLACPLAAQDPQAGLPPPTPVTIPGPVPVFRPEAEPLFTRAPLNAVLSDTDLLRRRTFTTARQAFVTLRVTPLKGQQKAVPGASLRAQDFTLLINGTQRSATLAQPVKDSDLSPSLLVTFPPNEPVVHTIGLKQARDFFSTEPELLPWSVGVLDSDGSLTSFTTDRRRLLSTLDTLAGKLEPFQYRLNLGLDHGVAWDGPWLRKAYEAINTMGSFDGPKIILAMNPLNEGIYGKNEFVLSHAGPELLIDAAAELGAHIYIANVGGPPVALPFGDATNTAAFLRGSFQRYAFANSLMQQTAQDTFGGFANSLDDLGKQMQRDLNATYTLTFDMTPADRDLGVPVAAVRLNDPQKRLLLMDIAPITSATSVHASKIAKSAMDKLYKASGHSPVSPNFSIAQHVDYFPTVHGLAPILPMSALIRWTGRDTAPPSLSVAEFLSNTLLSNFALERELHFAWNGHAVTWERDGHLAPGKYTWRIVLHNESGAVLASADKEFSVDFPQDQAIMLSDLILSRTCDANEHQQLRRRSELTEQEREQPIGQLDPLRVGPCRLLPDVNGSFVVNDTLHAFLRLYPANRLEKTVPEAWTVHLLVRSQTGAIELDRETPLLVDSGSGFVASLDLPLSQLSAPLGNHTLEAHIRGPGIHKQTIVQRAFTITDSRSR